MSERADWPGKDRGVPEPIHPPLFSQKEKSMLTVQTAATILGGMLQSTEDKIPDAYEIVPFVVFVARELIKHEEETRYE
jgi:hypothetical protein